MELKKRVLKGQDCLQGRGYLFCCCIGVYVGEVIFIFYSQSPSAAS